MEDPGDSPGSFPVISGVVHGDASGLAHVLDSLGADNCSLRTRSYFTVPSLL